MLWGKRGEGIDRCTYLAINAKDCPDNEVLLEVEYDPYINPKENNFNRESWQCRVYEPISSFKRIAA